MTIYLTRHGQTDWNIQGKIQGISDVEINNIGIKQAELANEKIKKIKIDLIICSPLKRAKKTAKIINKGKNIPIIYDNRIIERNFGEYEGTSFEFDKLWNYQNDLKYTEAESVKDFLNRIYKFLDEIKNKYYDKNILIVTHGGVSIAINCYFKGIPKDGNIVKYCIHNCEIQKFKI